MSLHLSRRKTRNQSVHLGLKIAAMTSTASPEAGHPQHLRHSSAPLERLLAASTDAAEHIRASSMLYIEDPPKLRPMEPLYLEDLASNPGNETDKISLDKTLKTKDQIRRSSSKDRIKDRSS